MHRLPGYVVTDREFDVPLDHSRRSGPRINVFAREVVAPGKEDDDLPWIVYLQGGPGSEAPRPRAGNLWLKRLLRDYRVLLLDQRGTGRSTPATYQTLARFASAEEQADFLKLFRADSIVRDAEWVRRELLGDDPWSVLGQSYGGFCAVTYLSFAPEGLREVLVTGGLPPLDRSADDVYRATYQRVRERNRRYYDRYPEDAERVAEIADALDSGDVRLPDGARLSTRRFRMRGGAFGGSTGFERVHYLVESAFVDGASGRELDYRFLRDLTDGDHFERNPLYAVLHEPIYAQGEATHWSAERMLAELPEFDLGARPLLFTGEMIYPWMFEEYPRLQPLREAAELLAAYEEWPPLYDAAVLRQNEVPVAAAVYDEDMYVERAFSDETARTIRGTRAWVTNEFEHDGLGASGERVVDRLLAMVRGE